MRDALQGRSQGNSLQMQLEEVAERSQEQHEYAISHQSDCSVPQTTESAWVYKLPVM